MKKRLHCACLFANGHVVLVFQKHDRPAKDISWAEVVEKFDLDRPEDTAPGEDGLKHLR